MIPLEQRVGDWIKTRIGPEHMHPQERALRALEEAMELAQAEGVSLDQVNRQAEHVFSRPPGDPEQEVGGVGVCLLGWCAARGIPLITLIIREVERIEAKPLESIRGSLARKMVADLVTLFPPPAVPPESREAASEGSRSPEIPVSR
jgi:hypothetical protein